MNNPWLKQPINNWLPTEWYTGYLPRLPDLCVGKLPPAFGRSGTKQWKVWIVETPDEGVALRGALSRPIPMRGNAADFKSGPDAPVSKVDPKRDYGNFVVALYVPPNHCSDWPWITLTRLPSTKLAGKLSPQLMRGVYAFNIDMTEAAALDRIHRLQMESSLPGGTPQFMFPDEGSQPA